jgi:hypothetical protein
MRGRVQSGRELAREIREAERSPLPTALPPLDRLLAGGLPRGQLVELIGGRSSGRFSTVLQTLAAATSVGEAAALVDLGDGLDPLDAVRLGVDLSLLLWLRPCRMQHALAAVEMVIGSGFPLVVLDLGPPPLRGGRRHEAAWLRLARAARQQGCAVLVAAPYRVSGTAAGAVLRLQRGHPFWNSASASADVRTSGRLRPLLAGASSTLSLEKRRGGRHAGTAAEPLALRAADSMAAAPSSSRSLPRAVSPPAQGDHRQVTPDRVAVGG